MSELIKQTEWDTPYGYGFPDDEVLEFIRTCPTCVIVRTRKDGHPVGYVVGHGVIDGEIYTITNTFRATHRELLRDPRCSAVFDNHKIGSVTVIGRAEIVDEDQAILRRIQEDKLERTPLVSEGMMSREKFLELAVTANRRLVHIIPEKFSSLDLRRLPKG